MIKPPSLIPPKLNSPVSTPKQSDDTPFTNAQAQSQQLEDIKKITTSPKLYTSKLFVPQVSK